MEDENIENESQVENEETLALKQRTALKKRIITGAILVFSLGTFCYLATFYFWARIVLLFIAFLVAIVSLFEFIVFSTKYYDVSDNSFNGRLITTLSLGIPILGTFLYYSLPVLTNIDVNYVFNLKIYNQGLLVTLIFLLASLFFSLFYILNLSKIDSSNFETRLTHFFPAFILLSVGGCSLVSIAALPFAPVFVVFLVAIVAATDIAAFFGGRYFKGGKLIQSISPNKTLSGAISGLVAAFVVSFLLTPFFNIVIVVPAIKVGLFGVLISVASQIGDILESYLKRLADVKDSGNLLPGHGGMFDRIDGLLAAAPLYYIVTLYFLYR